MTGKWAWREALIQLINTISCDRLWSLFYTQWININHQSHHWSSQSFVPHIPPSNLYQSSTDFPPGHFFSPRQTIFSIMCCAILFPAGPEAVLRQPLEDMKACVSGGAWVQPGEGCTWIPLAHNPSSYMTRCMFYIQIFYFSRVSWLRRPSWVPYPLPYPDPSLFTPLSTSSQDE